MHEVEGVVVGHPPMGGRAHMCVCCVLFVVANSNFTLSWKSGMAFCALIHKHFPQAIDYDSLDAKNAKGVCLSVLTVYFCRLIVSFAFYLCVVRCRQPRDCLRVRTRARSLCASLIDLFVWLIRRILIACVL